MDDKKGNELVVEIENNGIDITLKAMAPPQGSLAQATEDMTLTSLVQFTMETFPDAKLVSANIVPIKPPTVMRGSVNPV